ncbi:MAG: hypothetical protein E7298_14205 [Lachnospiraceae bacterium]|nr:hypothetical protein [Lachnospiraceae bacterium]
MRKTYAYNSIIVGFLLGWIVWIKAGAALGIITGIAVSVVGFVIIRAIEQALSKGVDAAVIAAKKARENRKQRDENE